MGRLIFFEGAYDTLDLFAEELRRAFEQMGDQCMVFTIQDMDASMKRLTQFMVEPVDAVVTLNNLGFSMELSEGKILWDAMDIPCINILMDHPFHYKKALEMAPKKAILLCTDRNHVSYVKRHFPNIWKVDFLPHAGIEWVDHGKCLPIQERNIDILYAGAMSRGLAQQLMPDFEKFTKFRADDLTEQVLADLFQHPEKTTEDAIESYLQQNQISYTEEELSEIIADMRFLDSFAVSFYREQVVHSLVMSGLRVYVVGRGWECCEWKEQPEFEYHGLVTAPEVLDLMQHSKIVLNTMTWFKEGTHDRVFNGMLAGAVAVTDTSGYMKEQFQDRDGICLFELTELASLPDQMRELLEHPEEMQKLADRGYEIAKKKHTWTQRAEYIRGQFLSGQD